MHNLLIEMIREAVSHAPEEFTQAMLDKAHEMATKGTDVGGALEQWNVYSKLMEEFGIDPKRRPRYLRDRYLRVPKTSPSPKLPSNSWY